MLRNVWIRFWCNRHQLHADFGFEQQQVQFSTVYGMFCFLLQFLFIRKKIDYFEVVRKLRENFLQHLSANKSFYARVLTNSIQPNFTSSNLPIIC